MATNGIYVVPERVERDGILVAFKGERMTTAEAERRGIMPEPEPKPKRTRKAAAAKAE